MLLLSFLRMSLPLCSYSEYASMLNLSMIIVCLLFYLGMVAAFRHNAIYGVSGRGLLGLCPFLRRDRM